MKINKKYLSVIYSFFITSCTFNIAPVNNLGNQDIIGNSDSEHKRIIDEIRSNILHKKDMLQSIDISINTGLIDKSNNNVFSVKASNLITRKSNQLGTGLTNNSHIYSNDKNIFNLNDPNSLKGLEPYKGDIQLNLINSDIKIGAFKFNDNRILKFEDDVLYIRFSNQNDINIFKSLYNSQVLEQTGNTFRVKVDLGKSPYQNLDNLIKRYNMTISDNIEKIEFSSISSIKLFSIILDFVLNYKTSLQGISLNIASDELPSNISTIYTNDWSQHFDINYSERVERNAYGYDNSGWYLRHPGVLKAWNYSIGTGSKIGWIENGLGYKLKHPEIKRRIKTYGDSLQILNIPTNDKIDPELYQSECLSFNPFDQCDDELQLYHADYSVMTCCAERNNNIPTVGVAPNVEVNPYSIYFIRDIINSIDKAVQHGANVIGINQSWTTWPRVFFSFDELSTAQSNPISVFFDTKDLDDKISEIVNNKHIPITVAAHNYAENIFDYGWYPANNKDVITVGGVTPTSNSNIKDEDNKLIPDFKVNYSETFKPHDNGKGSNYGKTDMVWAPGDSIDVARYELDINKIPDKLKITKYSEDKDRIHATFGGTSAANPFTSGVIALMISVNKDLTPQDIKRILINTSGRTSVLPSNNSLFSAITTIDMQKSGYGNTIKIINAEEAVKQAIRERKSGSTNPEDYAAKDYGFGIFDLNSGGLNQTENNQAIGRFMYNDLSTVDILRTASDEEFNSANIDKKVYLKGWDGNLIGKPNSIQVKNILGYSFFPPVFDNLSCSNTKNPGEIKNNEIITLTGNYLYSFGQKIQLVFKNVRTKQNFLFDINPLDSETKVTKNADSISFKFDANKAILTTDTTKNLFTENYSTAEYLRDTYNISFRSFEGKQSWELALSTGFKLLDYKGTDIAVIETKSKTPVLSGDKIAIPVNDDLKKKLQNTVITVSSGNRLTYYDIVNNYAIYGIDSSIPNGVQDIIAKDLSTGETVLSFEDALYKTALALNLNPAYPPGAKPKPGFVAEAPPFIRPNPTNDPANVTNVQIGDVVATSIRGLQTNDTVTVNIGNTTMPIYDHIGDYVAFQITGNAPTGLQNVTVSNAQGSVLIENTVNITQNQQQSNNVHKIVYTDYYSHNTRSFSIDNNDNELVKSDMYATAFPIAKGTKLAYLNPGNGYKVYISNSDGSNGNYLLDDNTFGDLQLDNGYGLRPPLSNIFSSDGAKAVGIEYNTNTGNTNIAIFNGSNVVLPLNDYSYHTNPRWSNDDKYISFIANENNMYSLRILNTNGFNISSVFIPTAEKLFEGTDQIDWYVWSPDSSKILFETGYGFSKRMYIVDIHTKVVTEMTPNSIEISDYSAGSWFPTWINNNEILFLGRSSDGSDDVNVDYGVARGSALFRLNLNSSSILKVPFTWNNDQYNHYYNNPVVSEDGKYVILHGYNSSFTKVYYMDLTNGKTYFLADSSSSGGWIKDYHSDPAF